jgi:hypothetical protein
MVPLNGNVNPAGGTGIYDHSEADAINDNEQIALNARDNSGLWHAYICDAMFIDAATGALGSLREVQATPLGGSQIYLVGINNANEAVGSYLSSSGTWAATLWSEPLGLIDLTESLGPGSPWTLTEADAINDKGQITGWGDIGGQTHAFRLTPPARPNLVVSGIEVGEALSSNEPDYPVDTTVADVTKLPMEVAWKPIGTDPNLWAPLIAGKKVALRVFVSDASRRADEPDYHLNLDFLVDAIDSTTKDTLASATEFGADTPNQVRISPFRKPNAGKDADLADNKKVFVLQMNQSSTHVDFAVEVNNPYSVPLTKECDGCELQGNALTLTGVPFLSDSSISGIDIQPFPLTIIDHDPPESSRPLPNYPRSDLASKTLELAKIFIPVPDDKIVIRSAPPMMPGTSGGFVIDLRSAPPSVQQIMKTGSDDIGEYLLAQQKVLYGQYSALVHPAVPSHRFILAGFGKSMYLATATTTLNGIHADPAGSGQIFWANYDVPLGAQTFAHELGHDMGLHHVQVTGVTPAPQCPCDSLGYTGIGVRGFDTNEVLHGFVAKTRNDLMSYDSPRWTSPRTWRRMLSSQCNSGSSDCSSRISPVRIGHSTQLSPLVQSNAPRQVVYGLVVNGVSTILGVTQMPAWYAQTLALGPSSGVITARSSAGKVLGSAGIVMGTGTDGSSGIRSFFADLPNVSGVASVKATSRTGKAIAELKASPHAPAAKFLSVPVRAAASKTSSVAYSATDADKQAVSVVIWARRGTSAWKLLVVGSTGGRASVVPKALGAKGGLQFKITATDGLRSTTVLSKAIPVV